ncbi:hypothetical protein TARUN_7954 [Trichoderma arundinaceum]|uniref:Uncharacterized protein n=1 Tax=Trichoderma arundinaceum TaxID=490622 RepID=A0A395NES7_TRIAR|nr:hypothetical protein TARUN_7954 [Trichoderma arundinaceum]
MPLQFSTKKSSNLAMKPEAMSSEVTLVEPLHTQSDKKATTGPTTKKTKLTWKEAQEVCRKERNWEARVSASR